MSRDMLGEDMVHEGRGRREGIPLVSPRLSSAVPCTGRYSKVGRNKTMK